MVAAEAWNVLEWTFIGALVLMTAVIGLFSVMILARVVEPKGLRVLLRRIAGKA